MGWLFAVALGDFIATAGRRAMAFTASDLRSDTPLLSIAIVAGGIPLGWPGDRSAARGPASAPVSFLLNRLGVVSLALRAIGIACAWVWQAGLAALTAWSFLMGDPRTVPVSCCGQC